MFLKIYKKPFSDELVNIVDDIYSLSISDDIQSYGTAEITTPIVPDIEYGQKVEVYMTQAVYTLYTNTEVVKVYYWDDDDIWNDENIWKEIDRETIETYDVSYSDVKIFEGYISRLQASIETLDISLTDNKGLLKRKQSLIDQEFVDVNISNIIYTVLDDFKTKTGEDIRLEIDDTLNHPVSETIQAGQSMYRIIDDMASRAGGLWTMDNNIIKIKEQIGEDKTFGDKFIELLYNPMNPQENNIAEINPESFDTQSNVVVGINNQGKHIEIDSTNVADKGALCTNFRFNDGDLTEKTVSKLNKLNNIQTLYSLTPETGVDANIGDIISVKMENTNEYLNFDGDVIVTEKSMRVEDGELFIDLSVGQRLMEKQEFTTILRNFQESFNILNTNL